MQPTVRIDRDVAINDQQIGFMRSLTINWALSGCRPGARMFPFFDRRDISAWVRQDGRQYGEPIVVDSSGSATGVFLVPSNTFRTGEREFLFSELRNHFELASLPGANVGTVRAVFASRGILRTEQITETRVTVQPRLILDRRWFDPVAQSFHTFGFEGGVFLHSIDLYFASKSDTVPVDISIVELRLGIPSNDPRDFVARTFLQPNQIHTSPNPRFPTVATRATFPDLVYLPPDKEYAFIVMAPNTNEYNLFSSRLGEVSFETGATISQQSYLGSMFKSQNNSTWTPVQEEDLKFSINICHFNTASPANVSLRAWAPSAITESRDFTTTSGSNIVEVRFRHKHGFQIGSNDRLELFVPAGVYNGLTAAQLTGNFVLQSLPDDYTCRFIAGGNATATGRIEHGQRLRSISVLESGSGYDDAAPPNVVISGGGGTGAAATAIVRNGRVTGVVVTNEGTGYTSSPTITLSSAVGSGARAVAVLLTNFTYITNAVFQEVMTGLPLFTPENTNFNGSLQFRIAAAAGIPTPHYQLSNQVQVDAGRKTPTNQNTMVANVTNQNTSLGGGNSGVATLSMSSSNANVSPVLRNTDIRLFAYDNVVNNQNNESVVIGNSANTELQAAHGTAIARYITRANRLLRVSNGARMTCSIYSTINTSVDVYLRASQSASLTPHEEHGWLLMACDVERNLSTEPGQFFDYVFYLDRVTGGFDVFQFKLVFRSRLPWEAPKVENLRATIVL